MKTIDIAFKTLLETIRNRWILLLTLLFAPLCMVVFYMINEIPKHKYNVAVVSKDLGIFHKNDKKSINYVDSLSGYISNFNENIQVYTDLTRQHAIQQLQNKELDVLIELPEDFSASLEGLRYRTNFKIHVYFIGNLSGDSYLHCAVWLYEAIASYVEKETGKRRPVVFTEEDIGMFSTYNEFDLKISGLLILSVIMVMLTAGIAYVRDKKHKTLVWLRMTLLKSHAYVLGIGIAQIIIAMVSMTISLLLARQLGFPFQEHLPGIFLIGLLTAVSVIVFAFMITSIVRTSKIALVTVFIFACLFILFSGVVFPVNLPVLFHAGDYPVHGNAVFSTSFAASAMHKLLINGNSMHEWFPDIAGLIIVTCIYALIGVYFYQRNHGFTSWQED